LSKIFQEMRSRVHCETMFLVQVRFKQPWSDPGPYGLVGTSTLLLWLTESMLALWSEELAKGPYQPSALAIEILHYAPV